MYVSEYAGKFFDAADPLRASWPEHLGQRIDPGGSDADVIHRDPGVASLVDPCPDASIPAQIATTTARGFFMCATSHERRCSSVQAQADTSLLWR